MTSASPTWLKNSRSVSSSPGVVAVDHHDVLERRRLDAAAIRPAEPHVALVDQQPDSGEPRAGSTLTSAAVPSVLPSSITRISCGERQRRERAREIVERGEDVLGFIVGGNDNRQRSVGGAAAGRRLRHNAILYRAALDVASLVPRLATRDRRPCWRLRVAARQHCGTVAS